MAIRVLIEREVVPGNELKIRRFLTQLRSKAMNAAGYISGETLQAVDNPNKYTVISTWNTLDDWKKWENDPERKKVQGEIDHLLRYPAKFTAYRHV